jgi:hypothetical protein
MVTAAILSSGPAQAREALQWVIPDNRWALDSLLRAAAGRDLSEKLCQPVPARGRAPAQAAEQARAQARMRGVVSAVQSLAALCVLRLCSAPAGAGAHTAALLGADVLYTSLARLAQDAPPASAGAAGAVGAVDAGVSLQPLLGAVYDNDDDEDNGDDGYGGDDAAAAVAGVVGRHIAGAVLPPACVVARDTLVLLAATHAQAAKKINAAIAAAAAVPE